MNSILGGTKLYPAGLNSVFNANGTATLKKSDIFFIKSENIKVFPSSWRGANLVADTAGIANASEQTGYFNPEATLHTEYNLTRSAGAAKTFIDEVTNRGNIFSFKFFLNGYAFEIYNLDTTIYSANGTPSTEINLYAHIRVGDLQVGNNNIDTTKVLMPFTWTDLTSPTLLDTTLEDLYTYGQTGSLTTWGEIVDKDPTDLASWLDGSGINLTDIKKLKHDYVFTGIAFSTKPLSLNTDGNYFSVQLLDNGSPRYANRWPKEVTSGQTLDGDSTMIGDTDSLISNVPHMLAVGKYNSAESHGVEPNENIILAVGNGSGLENNARKNALEVSGYNINSEDFSQTVTLADKVKINYSSEIAKGESGFTNATLSGVSKINDGLYISEAGNRVIINAKAENTDASAGLDIYGDLNICNIDNTVHSIKFKDNNVGITDITAVPSIDMVKDVTNPLAISIRGLATINNGAVTFNDSLTDADSQITQINHGAITFETELLEDTQNVQVVKLNRLVNSKDNGVKINLGDNFSLSNIGDLTQINGIKRLNAIKINNNELQNVADLDIYSSSPENGRTHITPKGIETTGTLKVADALTVDETATFKVQTIFEAPISSDVTIDGNVTIEDSKKLQTANIKDSISNVTLQNVQSIAGHNDGLYIKVDKNKAIDIKNANITLYKDIVGQETLSISKQSTLNTLTVNGASTFNSNVNVNADFTADSGTINGSLTVKNAKGALLAAGVGDEPDTVKVLDKVIITPQNMNVNLPVDITNDLTVKKSLAISDNLTVGNNLTVDNDLLVKNDITSTAGGLTVNGNIISNTGSLSVKNQVIVSDAADSQIKITPTEISMGEKSTTITTEQVNTKQIITEQITSEQISTKVLNSAEQITSEQISTKVLNSTDQISTGLVQANKANITEQLTVGKLVVGSIQQISGDEFDFKVDADSIFTDELKQLIYDAVYPVGSIYMTMSDEKPANKFGGTWQQISQGRMLLGADESGTYTVGQTGGSKDITVVPAHKHDIDIANTKAVDCIWTLPDAQFDSMKLNVSLNEGEHTHEGIATDSDISEHKHTIPVTMPITDTHPSLYLPDHYGTYKTTTETNVGFYSDVSDDHHYELDLQNYEHYTQSLRPGWDERCYQYSKKVPKGYGLYYQTEIGNMVTDKLRQLIPAVQMGTWYTPSEKPHLMVLNEPGPVYTGYQAMDISYNSRWITAFRIAWEAFKNYKVSNFSEAHGLKELTESVPLFGTVISNKTKQEFSNYPEDDDIWGISDKFFAEYTKIVPEMDKLLDQIYQDRYAILKTYAAELEYHIQKALSAAEVEFSKWLFKSDPENVDPSTHYPETTALFNTFIEQLKTASKNWHKVISDDTSDKYLRLAHKYCHEIKEIFVRDYVELYGGRVETEDSAKTGTIRDFKYRHDDGAHKHTLEINLGGTHNHTATMAGREIRELFRHKHEDIPVPTETKMNSVNTDGTNANIPPYIVCYIWQRIS